MSETSQNKFEKIFESSRSKTYTVTIVTLLLILIVSFFAVIPAVTSIFQQLAQNEQRNQVLTAIDNKRSNLRVLLNKHNENIVTAVGLDQSLPGEIDQQRVVEDMNRIITRSGGVMQSVQFAKLDVRARIEQSSLDLEEDTLGGLVVTSSIYGSRDELQEIVSEIEQSRRIYNITALGINAIQSEEVDILEDRYSMTFTFETYYWNL